MPHQRLLELAAAPLAALVAIAPSLARPQDTAERGSPAIQTRDDGERMRALLDRIVAQTPDTNIYLGDRELRTIQERIDNLPPDSPASVPFGLYRRLGEAQLRLGLEEAAIESMTRAYELLPKVRGVSQRMAIEGVYRLGVAWLRLAETRNCCAAKSPQSCVLPLRGAGLHSDTEPARKAMQYFLETLRKAPATDRDALAARWLLNIAAMAIDEYPDGVPEEYRIPPETFESEEPFPFFRNIASELGVDTFSLSGGAIADDFDGDGYLDLVVSTFDPTGQMRYFHNERDGTFAERTAEAGLIGERGGLNLVQADYDNDGDVDILVLRGAWLNQDGRHPNSLLRNEGDGTFTDVTFSAGLGKVHFPTQTASFADYDNDGDLDLFIGNETAGSLRAPCQLFRNQGDGTFVDVAVEAGVPNGGFTKAVVFGDYNGDDLPDLYVSNLGQPNRLYENLGDGTFYDVAEELGVQHPILSFPSWFFDFDQDGDLDIFSAAYGGNVCDYTADILGLPHPAEKACVYRNDGEDGFREVAAELGLTRLSAPMGSNFGDLDGDGYPDFYLGTGFPNYQDLMPNVMIHNDRGRAFRDVTMAGGFGVLQKGHAVVFADFDHDGDVDVFQELGGAFLGDKFRDALWENPGFGHHWLTVQCVGVKSNRSAIGARLRVIVEEEGKTRSVYRWVNSGGSFGANPLRQTLGLGDAERIVALEVHWPTTGLDQRFEDVPLDAIVRVEEFAEEIEVLELPAFRFRVSRNGDAGGDEDQGQ